MTSKKDNFSVMVGSDVQIEPMAKKLKCGLIMPISKSQGLEPEHWLHVKGIICEALADTDFDIRLVSESDDVGVIHKSIVQNIYQNDIVICDVSTHNANVMFELGLRLAFDKPTVIIKDDETPFSFDTQVIEHLVYKRSLHYVDILSFKKKLRDKVLATIAQSKEPDFSTFLKHFTINHVAKEIDERTVTIDVAVVERLEQMQKDITTLAQQQSKAIWNSRPTDRNKDDVNFDITIPIDIQSSVRMYLSSFASNNKMNSDEIKDNIKALQEDEFGKLISGYYAFMRDAGMKQIPPPPPTIRKEIINYAFS